MTLIPGKDAIWSWLITAPPSVVLSICLTVTSATAIWTWSVASEVRDQRATVAVAAEQAHAASTSQHRVEAKLDHLIEAVADLRATLARRYDHSKGKTQ
jgi:hypothetical protein